VLSNSFGRKLLIEKLLGKLDFNFRRSSSRQVKKQLENSKPLGESESSAVGFLNFSQLLVVYSAVFDYFGGCFSLPQFPEFFI
jgi:hypothetical protein